MPNRRGMTDDFREDAELFRFIVESAKDYAIFTMDRDGRVMTWNPGAERIFGYNAGEIVGEDAAIVFTPEDRERGRLELEMRTALEQGRAEDTRWHQRKDGHGLWVDGMMMPLKDGAGQARGFVKILRDRTAEKSSVNRLHASEARFRLMIESLKGYAIFSLDLEGRISSW